MRHILTSVVLLVLLFPSFALGATVKWGDIVERGGVHYKKFTDIPFSGTVTGSQQGKLKNGKKEGLWNIYWKNGQLMSKETYKDGKFEGPWTTYYKNGQLEEIMNVKDGRGNGPFVKYHKNGQLERKGNLKNGRNIGPLITYYDNGKLRSKENYKDGKKDGPWVWYNQDGTINEKYTGTYKDDAWSNGPDPFKIPN